MEAKVSDTAQARLERLLYVFPAASRQGGATLDALAAALHVAPAELLRDLHEATARAFYLPPGAADQIQILTDGNHVQVFAGHDFQRPVRLSQRETLALGIGLRMLAAEAESPERERRLELAARLERSLAAPITLREAAYEQRAPRAMPRAQEPLYDLDVEAPARAYGAELPPPEPPVHAPAAARSDFILEIESDSGPAAIELGHDQFRGVFADAIREAKRLHILYLKPGDSEPRERALEPLRLVYANGRWYALARAAGEDRVRVFRMDRILDAKLSAARFETGSFDAGAVTDEAGHVFAAADAVTARVRYSPRVARWILERTRAAANADGSVTLEHRVADADWLARHVLQYGADAQVEDPPELRAHVARVARSLATA